MEVFYKKKGRTGVAVLSGEIDHHASGDLRFQLDSIIKKSDIDSLILDMEKVNFMDSSGIGLLLSRYKAFKEKGGTMYVRNVGGQAEKIFKISGLYQVFIKID